MRSRLDSLAARIALGVLALVAAVIAVCVALVAVQLREQVEENLSAELQAAADTARATLRSRGELLDAVGHSLAGTPMLRAAIGGQVDTATMTDLVEQQRSALKLDLLALLEPNRRLLASTVPIGGKADFSTLEPGKPKQVMLGGVLYLAALHEIDADRQVLGYTLSALKLGQRFAETIAHQSDADVLLTADGAVLGHSVSTSTPPELVEAASKVAGQVQSAGALRSLVIRRELLTVVLAKNSEVAFGKFESTLLVLVLAGLLGAAIAGGLGLLMVRRSLQPLESLTENVLDMVVETDFTRTLEVKSTQEIRLLAQAFSHVLALLRQVLTQVRTASGRIGSGTQAMVVTVSKSESAASEHASSIRATSEASGELARQARQIAHSSGSVAEIAQATLSAARAGLDGAAAFTESMSRLKGEQKRATEVMSQLSGRMQQIGRVVEFINDVADKSELLALNAELEGQRAGVVGQSFSLVATEMRKLAENVTRSTREIETLIDDVKTATQEAVGATVTGGQASERASASAASVSESLRQITSMAEKTASQVGEISSSTQAQTNSTEQLVRSLARLQAIAQESVLTTQTLAGANTDLSVLAKELDQLVGSFKL